MTSLSMQLPCCEAITATTLTPSRLMQRSNQQQIREREADDGAAAARSCATGSSTVGLSASELREAFDKFMQTDASSSGGRAALRTIRAMSVGRRMEVGVFPAYPRAIAASEVLCVFLKLRARTEELVSLVISAAKMLVPETMVRRPAMSLRSRVSRQHWRGDNG
jgi:hypothetical protein